jgi:hypothetical protein
LIVADGKFTVELFRKQKRTPDSGTEPTNSRTASEYSTASLSEILGERKRNMIYNILENLLDSSYQGGMIVYYIIL